MKRFASRFDRKKKSVLAGAALALIAAGTFAGVMFAGGSEKPSQPREALALLRGFQPGSKITYGVSAQTGQGKAVHTRQVAQIDAQGEFAVPVPSAAAGPRSALDVSVQSASGRPLNVTFVFDRQTNSVTVKGAGAEPFSPVSFSAGAQDRESRADWAGQFMLQQDPAARRSNKDGTYKLAFASGALDLREGQQPHPYVIEVLEAPGGGGASSDGVNRYDVRRACNDDRNRHDASRYSFCDKPLMNQQIDQIRNNYVRGMMMMTEQLSAVIMQQVWAIGGFMDAKMQMQTQREYNRLAAQAHKDYHPSETMCEFGSFIKGAADLSAKGRYDRLALNQKLTDSYTGMANVSTAQGYAVDIESRIAQFRSTYCDPADNNGGLHLMCQADLANPELEDGEQTGGADPARYNKDIDYTRTFLNPLTLEIDFADGQDTPDEEDIIALGRNLYWPIAMNLGFAGELPDKYGEFLDSRHVFAVNNAAHDSFAAFVAMKAGGHDDMGDEGAGAFMKAMLRDLDMPDAEIEALLGKNPGYYAQMDVLTKKIYQNPDFYTNLYDKPANVERIGVAMQAFELMQGRDRFDSALRREMLTSLLVEQALAKHVDRINAQFQSGGSR